MSELTQAPATLIRAILQWREVITIPQDVQSWPCYIAAMPDGDTVFDECVSVYDTGGSPQGREMRNGQVFEYYGCQIKVRARDYQDGWNRIGLITRAIDSVTQLGMDAVNYVYFIPSINRGVPLSLGPEPGTKRRFYFTLNITFNCTQFDEPFLNLGDDFYAQVGRLHTLINVTLPPLLVKQ